MDKITVSAKTYDEAVTKALLNLQTSSERVSIKVIEEGSSGFLGLFAKSWVIEARIKESYLYEDALKEKNVEKASKTEAVKGKKEASKEANQDIKKEIKPEHSTKKTEPVKEPVEKVSPKQDITEEIANKNKDREVIATQEIKEESPISVQQEEILEKADVNVAEIEAVATKFLTDVFSKMDIPMEYETEYNEKDRELTILLRSEKDMGILIGKRGQTLDSLQYLASLVINKSTKSYIRLKLDTENYRSRRKDKLEALARSIASKVKKTRKPVVLEPMNPYERRIIHSILQEDKFVVTKSEGEDPYRHITVLPKNNRPRYNKYTKKRNAENQSE